MKSLGSNLLIAVIMFLLQTLLEISLITCFSKFGVPYLRTDYSRENFFQILLGVSIFYGLSKLLYTSWIYIPVYAIVRIFTRLNYFILNGFLSLIIFVGLILLNDRDIMKMTNPLISIILASILIYIIGNRWRNFKREKNLINNDQLIDN